MPLVKYKEDYICIVAQHRMIYQNIWMCMYCIKDWPRVRVERTLDTYVKTLVSY